MSKSCTPPRVDLPEASEAHSSFKSWLKLGLPAALLVMTGLCFHLSSRAGASEPQEVGSTLDTVNSSPSVKLEDGFFSPMTAGPIPVGEEEDTTVIRLVTVE